MPQREKTRVAPPAGHVYLADVLDIVRRHAAVHRWCGEAEEFIRKAFGLSEEDMPYNIPATWCCMSCDGPPPVDGRFTLADPAKVIRVSRLKDAVRAGIREYGDNDDDGEYRAMFIDVIDKFGLPVKKPVAP